MINQKFVTYNQEGDIVNYYFNKKEAIRYVLDKYSEEYTSIKLLSQWKIEKIIDFQAEFIPYKSEAYLHKNDVCLIFSLPDIVSANLIDYGIKNPSNYRGGYKYQIETPILVQHDGIIIPNQNDFSQDIDNTEHYYPLYDKQLLFSIKCCQPSYDEGVLQVCYSGLSLLPSDNISDKTFLHRLALTPFSEPKMKTKNYAEVQKGEVLTNMLFSRETDNLTPLIAKESGYLYFENIDFDYNSLAQFLYYDFGKPIFTIFKTKSLLLERVSNNYMLSVEHDKLTQATTIKGKNNFKIDSSWYSDYFQTPYHFYFLIKCIDGIDYMDVVFDKKSIAAAKGSTINFIFEDGNRLSYTLLKSPIKEHSYWKTTIKLNRIDIVWLSEKNLIGWTVNNNEGEEIARSQFVLRYSMLIFDMSPEISGLYFQVCMKKYLAKVEEVFGKSEDMQEQTPIQSSPTTSASPRSQESRCSVYLMIDTTNNFHKIGISNKPKYREHTLQSDKPTIELICSHEYPTRTIAEAIEAALHKAFAQKRIRGEWFNLDPQDVQDIKETLGY